MDFLKFVIETNIPVIVAIYVIGMILKGMKNINDKFIPVILLPLGIALTCAFMKSFNAESIVQGILVVGAAVYTNQLIKQLTPEK